MVGHVDAVGLGLRCGVATRGGECADAQRGDAASQEFAPAHARGAASTAPEQGASKLAHGVLPYFVIVGMSGEATVYDPDSVGQVGAICVTRSSERAVSPPQRPATASETRRTLPV